MTMWDYFIKTNFQNFTDEYGDYIEFLLDDLTLQKIIFCVDLHGKNYDNFIQFFSYSENYEFFEISFDKNKGKKQYDGTTIFSIDTTNIKSYYFLYAVKSKEYNDIDLVYVIFELKEYFNLFDYLSYKAAISNAVNSID